MQNGPLDPSTTRFVRVMEIFTAVGLVIMILSGILYFAGVGRCVPPDDVIRNWHLGATEFWRATGKIEPHGYSWFLGELGCPANISIAGIAVLMLAPLFSVLAVLPHIGGIYFLFYLILVLEFVYAVIRPVISQILGR